jgi:hypothetical protein
MSATILDLAAARPRPLDDAPASRERDNSDRAHRKCLVLIYYMAALLERGEACGSRRERAP